MRYSEILEACWSGYRQAGMKQKGDRQVPNCVPVSEESMEEDLRKWFKEKWVRFGPDGKIRGACARGSDKEGKPKCLPQSKAHALGKKGRASAAAKKRREDPNPERRGKAKNVATKVREDNEQTISVEDILAYLKKVMGTASHQDWRNHLINNNDYFVLKNVPVNSLKSDLAGLDKTAVEKYKQMDFSKAPPIVIGSDGHILDGYHRVNVAKALGIPTIKSYVGVKKQLDEKQDACYHKVKSRYKVWPSAYASGALVRCRKVGAKNWGTGGKKKK